MFNFIHVLSNRLLQVEWFKGMFGEKEEILEDVGEVFVETPKDISEPRLHIDFLILPYEK